MARLHIYEIHDLNALCKGNGRGVTTGWPICEDNSNDWEQDRG